MIDGATKISVVLADGTTYEGVKLAVVDPLNDVAFLKIDGESLGDVTIFNALGQRVAEFVADDEMMVNISHYPNGIYFVKVGDNIRRFVVTH